MKEIIKNLIYLSFVVCSASVISTNVEYSLFWCMGLINILYFGGSLLIKLLNYLDEK